MGFESPRDELLLGVLLAVSGWQLGSIGIVLVLLGLLVGVGAYVDVTILGRETDT